MGDARLEMGDCTCPLTRPRRPGRAAVSNQTAFAGMGDGFQAVGGVQFPVDVVKMVTQSFEGDCQFLRHFLRGSALGKEAEDASFLSGKRSDGSVATRAIRQYSELPGGVHDLVSETFPAFAFGDIPGQVDDHLFTGPLFLANQRRNVQPDPVAILDLHIQIIVGNVAMGAGGCQDGALFGADAGTERAHSLQQCCTRLVQNFLGRVTEQLLGGSVPRADQALHIDYEGGVCGPFQETAEVGLKHLPPSGTNVPCHWDTGLIAPPQPMMPNSLMRIRKSALRVNQMFSRASAYAIRALIELADQPPGKLVGEHEIAESERIPPSFLYKVLQQLRRGKLLRSYRGVNGGYQLACPADQITLLRVVRCMDGDRAFTHCVLENKLCGRHGECALHSRWVGERQRWMAFLEGQTLEMLQRNRADNKRAAVEKEIASALDEMPQGDSGAPDV